MARASVTALGAASAFAIGTWIAFGSVALYGPATSPRLALPGPPWKKTSHGRSSFSFNPAACTWQSPPRAVTPVPVTLR